MVIVDQLMDATEAVADDEQILFIMRSSERLYPDGFQAHLFASNLGRRELVMIGRLIMIASAVKAGAED